MESGSCHEAYLTMGTHGLNQQQSVLAEDYGIPAFPGELEPTMHRALFPSQWCCAAPVRRTRYQAPSSISGALWDPPTHSREASRPAPALSLGALISESPAHSRLAPLPTVHAKLTLPEALSPAGWRVPTVASWSCVPGQSGRTGDLSPPLRPDLALAFQRCPENGVSPPRFRT
ncbi:hypothetical protein AAFF_G00290460 [Aldrovandia affinis]|uniref:Uncharacterized protein n=1 Tax=Aldrovandia affinis TaxID=143900 RepID=A0AAD7W0V9_9TELE|nr:hypothetical protein AAFF_G00290460 [Aldrovandia affinis]